MHKNNYVIYLSSEEINEFLKSDSDFIEGIAYEWENENVVHLHTHSLIHGFGNTKKCLFKKGKLNTLNNIDQGADYMVNISLESDPYEVKVTKLTDHNTIELDYNFIPGKKELYSRSKGLIEVDVLANKHVAIIGLGSFGSQIAIELAKAGVGLFTLIDFDRIELHNLGRHTATTKDLGRLKIDVIEESILGKNPFAKIEKLDININRERAILDSIVSNVDILICATDNNESRYTISTSLHKNKKTGIFGRAITRAAGGDVFRFRPGGPCYSCLIGTNVINPRDEEISSEESGRRNGSIPAYVSSEEANAVVQVGLSADIEPICNFMVKLTLLELSKGLKSGISSLEEDLKYDAYIWANRRDHNFANWHPFYQSGIKPTILKWYGITVPKDDHCAICSYTPILDTGIKTMQPLYREYEGMDIKLDD